MAEEDLRLFVAVALPDRALRALGGAIDRLRTELSGAFRWSAPGTMHLTVRFIGGTPPERAPEITAALEEAAARCGPLELRLDGAGAFYRQERRRRTPTVVWAGLGGGVADLAALHDAVEAALTGGVGPAPETTAFRPHLTLARVRGAVTPVEADRLRLLLAAVRFDDMPPFAVESVRLMQSELLPGGARHTTLAEALLGGVRE